MDHSLVGAVGHSMILRMAATVDRLDVKIPSSAFRFSVAAEKGRRLVATPAVAS
jgi:hypothetical protein